MSASPGSSSISGNDILDSIEGGEHWNGVILYNRVDPGVASELQAFSSNLPADYSTDNTGVTNPMWDAVAASLKILQGYASFQYALSNASDANYFVSDFYKPGNVNTAGIAARPGNIPILGFNAKNWDSYTPQQQSYIVVHELCHTLGLTHPNGLADELDYSQYTIMSYDWFTLGDDYFGTGTPLTPMAIDVALLQAKYGASAANDGATSYVLGGGATDLDGADGVVRTGAGFVCIWDTSGIDSIVYEGFQSVLLNLSAAVLDSAAPVGDLADIVADVADNSRILDRLSLSDQALVTDPRHFAGGFFSSTMVGGELQPYGYTIAKGAVVEQARGGAGGDLLIGNEAANTLMGFGGNDELFGGSSNDTLDAAAGDDRAFGGFGDDSIVDSGGQNYLRGDEGDDVIRGGAAFDDINGNVGSDTASGGDGDDWVVGGKDGDRLLGEVGADIVYGNLGADDCVGGDGNDIVRGGQQDDILSGGAGDDWLSGDRDNDTISGGLGADIFHSFGDAGLDRITDFNRSEGDRVLLDPGSTYTVAQSGGDTVISVGGGAQVVLVGVSLSALTGDWIAVG